LATKNTRISSIRPPRRRRHRGRIDGIRS
jgi:hypothetical protein